MAIENQTPASGAGAVIDPTLPGNFQGAQEPNGAGAPIDDIDKFFGSFDEPSSGEGQGDGILPDGTSISGGGQTPQTDPTRGMTPDQLAKHFQSLYDKTNNELSQLKPKYEQYKSVADFLNQVNEDPAVKQAFLAEIAPDKFQPTDPYEALQEQLKKEFGDNFTPDDDEAAKPLTKSWRYYKRVDELYKDLAERKGSLVPKTLKELREERQRLAQEQALQNDREKQELMQSLKWDEGRWNRFTSEFIPKLKTKHVAQWFDALEKRQSTKAPNLVNQFGGVKPNTQPEIFNELSKFFG